MYYFFSFVAYFLVSFFIGVLWYIVLFKERYHKVTGDLTIASPLFYIGLPSLTLFAVTVVAVFGFAYPILGGGLRHALLILFVMWVPHYACTLGTAAKYKIAKRRDWLLLELGFVLLNVVALAVALMVVYGIFHR